jgi:hypothetical protein
MAKVGRNDPCPCGSGKKYKACCLARDSRRADLRLDGAARATAGAAPAWQADVVPFPVRFDSDPDARPGAVLVVGGGLILHSEILMRPSGEHEGVAAILEQAVLSAGRVVGSLPARVQVRHREVAAALRPRLASRDITVRTRRRLGDMDAAAHEMLTRVAGWEKWPAPSAPEMWAGWDLPPDRLAEFFRAAAAFYRASPWRWFEGDELLQAALPGRRSWTALVLGALEMERGLVLCSEQEDAESIVEDPDFGRTLGRLRGRVYVLYLEPRGELPRAMQREIASAGWEVADTRAYPMMTAYNTPAGGISRRDAGDLVRILAAFPEFVETRGAALAAGREVEWRDPATDVRFHRPALDFAVEDAWLWDVPPHVAPGGPEGPGSDAAAAVHQREDLYRSADLRDVDRFVEGELEVVMRFESWLRALGLSEATVRKHASNAATFVRLLAGYQTVPVRAVHEYDLRVVLYDVYPRKVPDGWTQIDAMPTSLRRFFAFLAEAEGISCPWVEPILRDRRRYASRVAALPSGAWWDPAVQAWRAPLYDDLEARAMLPEPGLGESEQWGETMGTDEALLYEELHRRWLLWRDELILEGTNFVPELRAALLERQRAWETTPQPRLAGLTPIEAIERERVESDRRDREARRQAGKGAAGGKKGARRRGRRGSKRGAAPVYELRVALSWIEPPIWRRVQVPGDTTLAGLHRILQIVMGWHDSHLHEFRVGDDSYGDPEIEELDFIPEDRTRLDEVAPGPGARLLYQYDFGDSWEHEIEVEQVLDPEPGVRYPRCTEGARSAPPEDCGGVGGYEEFLEAISDPRHPEHEELLEWIGGDFDPEAFDIDAVNRGLRVLGGAPSSRPG